MSKIKKQEVSELIAEMNKISGHIYCEECSKITGMKSYHLPDKHISKMNGVYVEKDENYPCNE